MSEVSLASEPGLEILCRIAQSLPSPPGHL